MDLINIKKQQEQVFKSDIYKDLKNKPLCWDFDILKLLKPKQFKKINLSESELLKMWNENIKIFISIGNQKSIEGFIHHNE